MRISKVIVLLSTVVTVLFLFPQNCFCRIRTAEGKGVNGVYTTNWTDYRQCYSHTYAEGYDMVKRIPFPDYEVTGYSEPADIMNYYSQYLIPITKRTYVTQTKYVDMDSSRYRPGIINISVTPIYYFPGLAADTIWPKGSKTPESGTGAGIVTIDMIRPYQKAVEEAYKSGTSVIGVMNAKGLSGIIKTVGTQVVGVVQPTSAPAVTTATGYVDDFDPVYYAQNNPDVVAVFGTDAGMLYQHYLNYGKAEGRKPHA